MIPPPLRRYLYHHPSIDTKEYKCVISQMPFLYVLSSLSYRLILIQVNFLILKVLIQTTLPGSRSKCISLNHFFQILL